MSQFTFKLKCLSFGKVWIENLLFHKTVPKSKFIPKHQISAFYLKPFNIPSSNNVLNKPFWSSCANGLRQSSQKELLSLYKNYAFGSFNIGNSLTIRALKKRLPLHSLLCFGLTAGHALTFSESDAADNLDAVCNNIQNYFQSKIFELNDTSSTLNECKFDDFVVGQKIGQGCSSAVYSAYLNSNRLDDSFVNIDSIQNQMYTSFENNDISNNYQTDNIYADEEESSMPSLCDKTQPKVLNIDGKNFMNGIIKVKLMNDIDITLEVKSCDGVLNVTASLNQLDIEKDQCYLSNDEFTPANENHCSSCNCSISSCLNIGNEVKHFSNGLDKDDLVLEGLKTRGNCIFNYPDASNQYLHYKIASNNESIIPFSVISKETDSDIMIITDTFSSGDVYEQQNDAVLNSQIKMSEELAIETTSIVSGDFDFIICNDKMKYEIDNDENMVVPIDNNGHISTVWQDYLHNFDFMKIDQDHLYYAENWDSYPNDMSDLPACKSYNADTDYPLALKICFNFCNNHESTFTGLERLLPEMLLARVVDNSMIEISRQSFHRRNYIPLHPSLIPMLKSFIDDMPCLPGAIDDYPLALSRSRRMSSIDKEGIGGSQTSFLVMPKCDMTLTEYLLNHKPSYKDSIVIFVQLVEAIKCLNEHNIAHRDLKCNNILVNVKGTYPQIMISDFSSCFAGTDSLKISFNSQYMSKGGNIALMAPEILNALPTKNMFLDYSHSDEWSLGAIAYEIFGKKNPFYENLTSSNYIENDLPNVTDLGDTVIDNIVKGMLSRNPYERPSLEFVTNCLHSLLWLPSNVLMEINDVSKILMLNRWFQIFFTEVVFKGPSNDCDDVEYFLKVLFLKYLNSENILASMKHIRKFSIYQQNDE